MERYQWAEVLLLEFLHIIILYPTRQHVYRVVISTAMLYLAVRVCLTPMGTVPPTVIHAIGCTIGARFIFRAYYLTAEGAFPDHWRRVRDEVHANADAGGVDKLPSNFPLTKKLWWMVDLAYSVRMIGWTQEPQNCMPPHPLPSRRAFLWKTFLKFVMNTITSDLAVSVFALSPTFDHRVHDPTDGPETYLAAVPLLRRIPYAIAWCIGVGASMGAIHNALAFMCVGLGLSSPALWPDVWGRWRDAYTVRRFWGKAWHQQLRPPLAGLGRLVANKLLRYPRGTNQSSYIQLYIAFFLSGIVHFIGDFILEKRMVYRSYKFFLLQAVAITIEDFVIYIAKRSLRRGENLKPGKVGPWTEVVTKFVGYCWVILWLTSTLPGWLDELNALGCGSTDRRPITQFVLDKWNRRA